MRKNRASSSSFSSGACVLAGALSLLAQSPATAQGRCIEFKLLASDGEDTSLFGNAVAVSGNVAVVGAPQKDDNGISSGAAYVFDVETGQQLAKLLPNDAMKDSFGFSVAIRGSIVLVGQQEDDDNGSSSGSAYVFDAQTGQQLAKLLPSDGAAFDSFGYSVALSGTIALIGAYNDSYSGIRAGSAYLFDVGTGLELAKLLPNDGPEQSLFGLFVAISGTSALVGAPFDDDNGDSSGSAYLFDVGTGLQTAKLLPLDGAASQFFGTSVAISGSTPVVGAYLDDDQGPFSGSA